MAQKKTTRTAPPAREAEQETKTDKEKSSVTEKGKELAEDLDKLMDEIDDVLEKNAEEFVKNYVQKGGQ
jgi:ubiquitin-like protein Pup